MKMRIAVSLGISALFIHFACVWLSASFGCVRAIAHAASGGGVAAVLSDPRETERAAAWDVLAADLRRTIADSPMQVGLVVKDLSHGRTISMNELLRVPSASLVKVPVMAAYFNAIKEGAVRPDETLVLKKRNKVSGSGVIKFSAVGTGFPVSQVVEYMITKSDNCATNMLIDRLGPPYLNAYFKRIGLAQTNLARKMMYFESRKRGIENYTTAADMAYLLEGLYRGNILPADMSKACIGLLKKQELRDRIPKLLPVSVPIAHKTGLEQGVCHDIGIVYAPEGTFLIVALTKHQNKTSARSKQVIATLTRQVYDYFLTWYGSPAVSPQKK